MTIRIQVPGQPKGKGRARAAKTARGVRMYTPAATVAYEGLIALAGQDVMQGRELIDGPVYLTVTAYFEIPKSRAKKIAALPIAWHTSKPDGDNVLKAVGDGLNGIVWSDDSRIAFAKIVKQYGDKPGLDILVEALS